MIQSMKTSSSIFIISFIFISTFYSKVNGQNLIQETCKKLSQYDSNVYYDFCEAALGTAPGGLNATSVTQLGLVSFMLDVSEIPPIISKIETLLGEPECDPPIKDALNGCLELYLGAHDDLVSSLEYFEAGNFIMAKTRASVALNVPSTCEGGFMKKYGVESVLTTENNDFLQLVAISVGFTTLLATP